MSFTLLDMQDAIWYLLNVVVVESDVGVEERVVDVVDVVDEVVVVDVVDVVDEVVVVDVVDVVDEDTTGSG